MTDANRIITLKQFNPSGKLESFSFQTKVYEVQDFVSHFRYLSYSVCSVTVERKRDVWKDKLLS